MKLIDIAIKDFIRSFRSLFALVFMFGMPLLVTGMFYFMFGNLASQEGFNLPVTRVVIANLDEGHAQTGQLGQMIVETLQSPDFASLMEVTIAPDAASARQAVDAQQAGVAVIIPANFSASFADPEATVEIEIYKDPTLTIGPGIVQSVLNQFTDSFAGIKIAVSLALERAESGEITYEQIAPLIQEYMLAAQPEGDPAEALLDLRSPAAAPEGSLLLRIVGPIMGGMMIFYAFFTGMSSAESILKEEEEGTLSRLFTTPTSQAEILGGKFLAVALTVLVQIIVLLLASRLIFGIEWGALPAVALFVLATAAITTTSGLLVNAFLKNSKQGGIIFGGLLTVTGMVGMMDIFTGNAGSARFGILPLLTPQGWAARSLLSTMNGAAALDILPSILVLLAMSMAFFAISVWRFQKRYA